MGPPSTAPTRRRPRPLPLALAAGLALAALSTPVGADDKIWTETRGPKKKHPGLPSLAPLVARASKAVLVVYTEGRASQAQLPPGHPATDERVRGEGAGFLIHPSGYALTNHHVVENAERVVVRVGDAPAEIEATLVGADKKTDIALLKLSSSRTDWPVIPLGDSDALEVGDFVVAIGNPFGLDQTVSLGILSARGRRDVAPGQRMGLYNFLQTDASINPGNSGGPLLNLDGEAIGMNTAVNAAAQGIGFAIPINMAKQILPALKRDGRVARSWLGISIARVTPELARAFGLPRPEGAVVRAVTPDSPAGRAGLLPGDVILKFDTRKIIKANALPLLAGAAGIGRKVPLRVLRDGTERTVVVTLGAHPENETERPALQKPRPGQAHSPIGMKIVTLNDADRKRLDVPRDVSGARVIGVKIGSVAEQAGLRPDDVVIQANDRPIQKAEDLAGVVKQLPPGGVLRLLARRGEQTVFLALVKP